MNGTTKEAPLQNNSMQVQVTTDYTVFKSLRGNRKMNELHLQRLLNSFKEQQLVSPITVNEKMEVIDGQHRLYCSRKLNLPVYYIVCTGYGLNEVHRLNASTKDWTAGDYMEGYCSLKKPNYILYREFKEKFAFGHNVCQAILSGSTTGGRVQQKFKKGDFEIPNLNESTKIAEKILEVSPYYEGYNRHRFVLAIIQVLKHKNFVFDEFISKLKIQRTALTDCVNAEQYLEVIEKIYNYKRAVKVSLRY